MPWKRQRRLVTQWCYDQPMPWEVWALVCVPTKKSWKKPPTRSEKLVLSWDNVCAITVWWLFVIFFPLCFWLYKSEIETFYPDFHWQTLVLYLLPMFTALTWTEMKALKWFGNVSLVRRKERNSLLLPSNILLCSSSIQHYVWQLSWF